MSEKNENIDVIGFADDEEKKVGIAINETLNAMRDDKNEREILGVENQDLEEDDEIVKNFNSISSIYDDEDFQKHLIMRVNSNTYFVNVEGGVIDDDSRKSILNEVLEAAKHEVLMFYGRDQKFANYEEEQKRKILEESVSDIFNFKMAKTVAASAIKEATAEQATPNTKENENFQQQALDDMRKALEAFYTKKPVTVKPQQILSTTVHTSDAMDEYENDLRKANLNKAAQNFNQKKEDYNQKRRSFWGKAFDLAKNVWKGIKQNKARIITDAAVVFGAGVGASSLGVAGLTTLGVSAVTAPVVAPIAAAAVMGAYFAASSFAWLVNDERRNQKAKSDDKAKWSGFNGLKNAWNSIMSDEQKKSKFLRQGSITATAGVAGAALFGAAASTMGLAYGRIASGAARSIGSVTNQGANWAVAANEFKKNATEENKAARDSARTGFFVSAVAALIANTVSAAMGLAHEADTNQPEVKTEAEPTVKTGTEPTVKTGTEPTVKTGTETTVKPGVDGTTVEHTPVEWQGHITEKQWDALNRDVTGIYKEHADILGKENVNPNDAMQNMYDNIDNARAAGYFQGQSNEEVLFKYVQLIKQTERAEMLKGTNYLVTKLDADGNPMYWVNAEEMKALNKIIICNEKVDISSDKIKDVMDLINEKGKYIGEGAEIGVTNNSYAGGRYDCNDYQNAWTKGAFVHKHPHINHQPAPAPVQEQPVPEKIEETSVNNIKQPARAARVEETTVNISRKADNVVSWQEKKFTTGDNTIDSGTGMKPEKIVAEGNVSETVARAAMQSSGLNR